MNVKRRPRGSMKEPVSVGWEIDRSVKDHFADLARKAGYTNSAFLELMMRSVVLDEDGTPTWVPKNDTEGQLPIDKP